MTIGRTIVAVLVGVIVAGVTIALVEAVGHAIGKGDGMFAAATIGYGLGALAGTAVATRIADRRAAIGVPVILAGLAAFNLMAFPHPGWFVPAALAALALGWWIGTMLGVRRSARGDAGETGR